jgi:prepilin-type processing-associated H-X9-DG protein
MSGRNWHDGWTGYPGSDWVWSSQFSGHLGTANYVFADGHVKALRPTQTGHPFNMWGSMCGGSGCDPVQSLNTDETSPAMLGSLQNWERAWNK